MTLVMAIAIGLVQFVTSTILDRTLVAFDFDGLQAMLEDTPDEDLANIDLGRYLGKQPFAQFYDRSGRLIYSSPEAQSSILTPTLLDLVPTEFVGSIASAMTYTGDDGTPEHVLIIQNPGSQPDNFYRISNDYTVLDASPGDRAELTPDELRMIFDAERNILGHIKFTYRNSAGDNRWLVLRYPAFDELAYNRALNMWRYSWVVLAALYVLLVISSIYWLNRKTKRLLEPLSQSIGFLRSRQPVRIDYEGPAEFMELYEQFNDLSVRLQRSEEQRQKMDENRSLMLAGISHDLKTPITVIQGYAHALHNEIAPPEERDKYLNTIYQKSIHLNRLIDNFFDFAKLNHPQLTLNQVRTNPYSFLQDYLAEKYQEIDLAGFSLEVDIPEDEAFALIDPIQLRRGFDNLISNTLKYSPQGTTIYASIRHGDDIEISIGDDGTGLPETLAANLFEPFRVGDAARSKNGTGLGLSITKRIIELHNGTIAVVSSPPPPYKLKFDIRLPRLISE